MRGRTTSFGVLAALLLLGLLGASQSLGQGGSQVKVPSIELSGDLNAAEADWIGHSLNAAADDGAPFAVVRLDTNGGLESSADKIVDHIRSAPMPVVVYVSPGGAAALDQGASIVDASDVGAMAPGTTLEVRGNQEGENTALKQGRVQLIAADQDELLTELDGFRVTGPKATTLETAGVEIDDQEMSLPYQVLDVLVDPNVAFVLLLVGLLGLALEAFAPGTVVPGVIGGVALILGIIGAIHLPVAAIGVVLLIAGIAMIIAEAHLPTAGILGLFGVGALIAGGLMIFDTDNDQIEVSTGLVIGAAGILGLATVFAGGKAMQAGRRPVASGPEALIGEIATVRTALAPAGQVFVDGALWEARITASAGPQEAGYRVRVVEIDGLTLVVAPLEGTPEASTAGAAGSEPEGAG
jgi:membrane-bound serine protease (ClpP class)